MASTYSNLSIELIGTGDQSGTWGTTTNTNLGTALEEAIVGTVNQAVTAVDLTLPWSTASNATQVARHSRLNLTGSSGGASNLIVPTLSGGKNYYIKNSSTTAITVKTAAGTGILVPAGNAMSLYQDGTNVVEAADYSTSYTIGTLTTTNDATINGLTVGKGANSISTNTAVGYQSLYSNTTGAFNTAVGYQTLFSNTTQGYNIAIGEKALYFNNGTALQARFNLAIGYRAGYSNTTGSNNTFIGGLDGSGFSAGYSNTTGSNNTAIGSAALKSNTTASNNTAVGYDALLDNTTGTSLTALGYQALANNTTGNENTAVGWAALLNNTTGLYNSAFGYLALVTNTTGGQNTALGHSAFTPTPLHLTTLR
jgi:trimeric autotransporter adhesin